MPDAAELLAITADANEASRAQVGDSVVVHDVKATLCALLDEVAPRGCAMPAPRPAPDSAGDREEFLSPDAVFGVVAQVAPAHAIYMNECTSTAAALWSCLKMTLPGSCFSSAAGGLGFGLPALIGVQLVRPDRPMGGFCR